MTLLFADEESDDQLPSWCHRGRQATQQLCIITTQHHWGNQLTQAHLKQTTILWSLYRFTCASQYPQLRTGGLC